MIREFFLEYQRSSRGRWILYRIESRGDNQRGKELKEVDSILEKMQRKSYYSVSKMEDIIGLRLISPYVSDLKEVVRYILAEQDKLRIHENQFHGLQDLSGVFKRLRHFEELMLKEFSKDDQLKSLDKIFPEPKYERRTDGYRAIHITVSLNKPVDLQDIKCEVQVSTSVLRALTDKTHDLIYKEREVEKPYRNLVSNISDGLFADDLQTEIVRKEILKRRGEETTRRRGVYIDHSRISIERVKSENSVSEEIRELCKKVENYIKDKETLEQIQDAIEGRIRSYLEGHIKYDDLTNDKFWHTVIDELGKPVEEKELGIEDIINYVKKAKKLQRNLDALIERLIALVDTTKDFSEYRILCQMISALAMSDDFGRFDAHALNCADRLINMALDKKQVAQAHSTKALLLYALSRFKEAYEVIQTGILEAEKTLQDEEPLLLAKLKNSCAYYAAERIDELSRLGEPYPNEKAEKEELEHEAHQFISEAFDILKSLDKNIPNKIKRTGGNQKQKVEAEKTEIDRTKLFFDETKIFIGLVCSSSVDDIAELLTKATQNYDEVCSKSNRSLERYEPFLMHYYAKDIRKASQRLAQILKL
jgi:ppGpp synthetase/RelA/SpoT-type nucleotidyltranferase